MTDAAPQLTADDRQALVGKAIKIATQLEFSHVTRELVEGIGYLAEQCERLKDPGPLLFGEVLHGEFTAEDD